MKFLFYLNMFNIKIKLHICKYAISIRALYKTSFFLPVVAPSRNITVYRDSHCPSTSDCSWSKQQRIHIFLLYQTASTFKLCFHSIYLNQWSSQKYVQIFHTRQNKTRILCTFIFIPHC